LSRQDASTLRGAHAKVIDVSRGRNRRSVWTVTTKPYKGAHFATFPPELIEPCILAGSKFGDVVLDPFMGSGTTAAVSIKHGRKYLGCELNSEYGHLQQERIESQRNLFNAS
jgi:DNA modification methylase